MSAAQVKALFQPFTQADTSTTRKYGGTGLGLTICRNLVSMMGGEIHVDSHPGDGSTFTFTAAFRPGKKSAPQRLAPARNLRDMQVLVVDDNPTFRDIMRTMLAPLSVAVSLAGSGEQGLAMVQHPPGETPLRPGVHGSANAGHGRNRGGSQDPVRNRSAKIAAHYHGYLLQRG